MFVTFSINFVAYDFRWILNTSSLWRAGESWSLPHARADREKSAGEQQPVAVVVNVPSFLRQLQPPADFVETANTVGLPRYAKQAVDQEHEAWQVLLACQGQVRLAPTGT